jgi:hypothetical protein
LSHFELLNCLSDPCVPQTMQTVSLVVTLDISLILDTTKNKEGLIVEGRKVKSVSVVLLPMSKLESNYRIIIMLMSNHKIIMRM